MQSFPWAFGLASNANGQACGITPNTYNCCYQGNPSGFYPPPVLGWTDSYNAVDTIPFTGLNTFYGPPPTDWNNTESPATSPYGSAGGKPGLQAYFQNLTNVTSGDINDLTGWNTFLNYYYWLHGSFDTLVGSVLYDLDTTFKPHPVIIFTSDHGDLGGSHTLHAKEGTLYDEAFKVPLIISSNGQTSATTRTFMCSSVDMLPFIYSLALGNESWRTNPDDIVSYLNNRESIFDSIMHSNADSRRLAPYTNTGGFGATGNELPYVLFSTDEYRALRRNPTTCPKGQLSQSGGRWLA